MRRMRWLAVLVGGLLAGLVFAAPASAGVVQSFILTDDPGPTQDRKGGGEFGAAGVPPDDLGAAGVILDAEGPPRCPFEPFCEVFDRKLGADGEVVGGGPYFDCDAEFHYHGFLFDLDDPNPDGCGWGAAIPFDEAPEDAQLIATVITLLTLAEEERLRAALADTKEALSGLRDIEEVILRNARGEAGYRGVTDAELIQRATKLTKKAKKLFKKAKKASKKSAKRKRKRKAQKKVGKALVPSREYFRRNVGPPPRRS